MTHGHCFVQPIYLMYKLYIVILFNYTPRFYFITHIGNVAFSPDALFHF